MKSHLFKTVVFSFSLIAIPLLITHFRSAFISTARAVGDLSVDWGVPLGQPIFTVSDLAPGQTSSHTVKVFNGSNTIRPIGIRGSDTANVGSFSDALLLTISDNTKSLYGPVSLTKFFVDSTSPDGIYLSQLNSGDKTSYLFTITFDPSAGNLFQNKSIVFDINLGISVPIPEACREIKFSGPPIFGTQGNDRLDGTNGNDLIIGMEGNDTINGHGGNDCVVGGPGNDTISGNFGNDVLIGSDGNDTLNGNDGNDLIDGGPGNDKLSGNNGNDALHGGSGSDLLEGGNGDDHLQGNAGNDKLYGNPGKDTLLGNEDQDFADGGLDKDTCVAESKTHCEL